MGFSNNLIVRLTSSRLRSSYFEADGSNSYFAVKELHLPRILDKSGLKPIIIESLKNASCPHSSLRECDNCISGWFRHVLTPEFQAIVGYLKGQLSPDFKVICDRGRGQGSVKIIAYVVLEEDRKTLKLLGVLEAHIVHLIIDKEWRIEVLVHEALHSRYSKHTKKFYEEEKKTISEVRSAINKGMISLAQY